MRKEVKTPSVLRARLHRQLHGMARRRRTVAGLLNDLEQTATLSAREVEVGIQALEMLADALLDLDQIAQQIPVGPPRYHRKP